MAKKRIPSRRSSSGPWFGDERARLFFEKTVRHAYPQIGVGRPGSKGNDDDYVYKLPVSLGPFEDRNVTITFPSASSPRNPKVTVDGPAGPLASPHRYSDGHLCLWYPEDEKHNRWTSSDGLVALIDLVRLHLIREAWWRESGEWIGPEIVHALNIIKKGES